MAQLNCSSLGLWNSTPDQLGCPEAVLCGSNITWPLVNVSQDILEDLCLSMSDYLDKYLGPARSPVFIPVCVTFLIIFVVGALGNALTCAVVLRFQVMRTPTNYYLFSLAVSDLLVLLMGMPLELYEMWHNYPFLLGEGGCYFKTFLFETVCLASILNVTALSVERYVAVVHPLKVKYVATRAHAKRVILTLWALSMMCALPNTSLHGVVLLAPRFGRVFPESAICGLVKPIWVYNLIILVTTLLFFLLPMVTISFLYLLIGMQLHRERSLQVVAIRPGLATHGHYSAQQQQQRARHRQVTKMLCVLVIVFGICWAPFHIDRLMWSYMDESWTARHHQIFEYVHVVSGVLFYLSSAVNPVLYNLMSTRFREMFKQVTCRSGLCTRHGQQTATLSCQLTLRSTLSAEQHNGPSRYMDSPCQSSRTAHTDTSPV